MVKKINAQNADLVVFAGDVFDNEYEAVQNPDKIAKTLSTILKVLMALMPVFGNHDVTERLLGGFSVTSKENEVRDPRFESFLKDAEYHSSR
ncbi:metallophosphoesterase [Blautia stercoris]